MAFQTELHSVLPHTRFLPPEFAREHPIELDVRCSTLTICSGVGKTVEEKEWFNGIVYERCFGKA